jgi:hypothetical protein
MYHGFGLKNSKPKIQKNMIIRLKKLIPKKCKIPQLLISLLNPKLKKEAFAGIS